MKSLSRFCLLLWLVPYFGKQYFPEEFSVWYIQWTTFGLLSVLLPFGFAKSVSIKKEQKYATFFLFIFLFDLFLLGTGLNLLKSTNTSLNSSVQLELVPENASLAAINNENPEVRSVIAQVVYKVFGQPIMYKDELNNLIIYSPSEEDKKSYRERFTTVVKAKEIIKNTSHQITEIMCLFGWACGCFLVVFVITFRLEQRKANK